MHWAYITTAGRSGLHLIGSTGYEMMTGSSMPSFGKRGGDADRIAALSRALSGYGLVHCTFSTAWLRPLVDKKKKGMQANERQEAYKENFLAKSAKLYPQ